MEAATTTPGLERDATAAFHAAHCSPSGRQHLDLFSGIGGFALAARWTGWNTIALSEIEPYACKILAKNFPGIPNLGDIRALRGIPCDLITGGFPCQPYSLAGKRRGASDDRALWPEMLRVIAESKPRWVLGENVPGIISLELDRVLSDLESLGFSAWPVCIPACGLDARHRRERLWIVAHAERGEGGQRCGAEMQWGRTGEAEQARLGGRTLADPAQRQDDGRNGGSVYGAARCRKGQHTTAHDGGEDVADAACQCQRESPDEANAVTACRDARQESGSGSRWVTEPDVGRVAHGIPARMDRLKGLGNAIVPQVAAALMHEMAKMENAGTQRPGSQGAEPANPDAQPGSLQ